MITFNRFGLSCSTLRWLTLFIVTVANLLGATVDVNVFGLKVGELNVDPYSNLSNATVASASISANFTTANQAAGGQGALNTVAPLGLTFMQTVRVNTNLQQLIFRPSDYTAANGFVLAGTHSDPPYKGYVLYDGSKQFETDERPWYSTIAPSGVAGAVPPTYDWDPGAGVNNQQLFDQPTIQWANYDANTYGMANLLNGQNGSLSFETALVGVCQQPNLANALTGQYKVCVLKDFTWGINFTYTAGGAAGAYTQANYTTALSALTFADDVSATFRGAFDQLGNNAPVEWNVKFTQANECPEPTMTLSIAVCAAGFLFIRYRRRKAGTSLVDQS